VACAPSASLRPIVASDVPLEAATVFRAFPPGGPPDTLNGPDSRWAAGADEPARVEATPEGLRLTSVPGRRAWAVPSLPVAPLGAAPPDQSEELTWDGTVAVDQRYFIVCELRFAGEPGAVLVQATPFDTQVSFDPERPDGGKSESLPRQVGDGATHFWRLRVAGGRVDLLLDGSPLWSLDGRRALAQVAFGEIRTDDGHGGAMLLRDLNYVRRPA
jgi:hypothetical protein